MIIECQTCHARFRLDEARIKGRGARVKCRKCGDSIVVFKDSAPAPPAPRVEGLFDLGAAMRESAGEAPASPAPVGNLIPFPSPSRPAETGMKESSSLAPEAAGPEKDEVDLAFERALSAGTGASFPPIVETEVTKPAPEEASAPQGEEASAGPGPRPGMDLGALILDFAPEEKLDLPPAEDLKPSIGDPPVVAPSAEFRAGGGFLISDSDTLDFLQEKHRDEAQNAPPGIGDISRQISSAPTDRTSSFQHEPDASPASTIQRDSPTPEGSFLEGSFTPPAPGKEGSLDLGAAVRESAGEAPASPAPESPRPRSFAGTAVAVAVAVLLVAGVYLGLTTSGRKTLEGAVPGVAALWGGNPAAPAGPKYDLRNVIGYYESGAASPKILVIKGQVANLSTVEKSGIRVHAVLLDNTDAVLMQQAVYAGNVLSGEAIRKGTRDTLSKTLENRFGEGLANMHVAPGKAIPFMVVFFDAPVNMDSYKLEAKDGE
ncbi:zinc-ribbon domain-containing protein [Candidatus Deferrimicrobium sp.]|uniref:zinc-ribbon domain-containing protein n=1 Tax=Candidatus Deferrimicrobium sp. TaxID=3060586 RepID=UPI002ED2DBA9